MNATIGRLVFPITCILYSLLGHEQLNASFKSQKSSTTQIPKFWAKTVNFIPDEINLTTQS